MIDFKPYAVFAEVVATGSMSAAARRLGMTPSAISQIIGNLERQMGVTLLHRSTRKLTLTEAGARCYPHSLRLIEAGRSAAASLEQARDAPAGELRIAAPVGFGAHVAPALAPVLAEWPRLRLRLIVDDALVDLVEHRIDMALRVGWQEDGAWHGRALGDLHPVVCAAPAYLERRGMPEAPADLAAHDWLVLQREDPDDPAADVGNPAGFVLSLGDGKDVPERIALAPRVATTNQIALQQMCEQAMGLACLFHVDARPALERGTLVRVLPRWRPPSRAVTLVMPRGRSEPAKVRVARQAIERYLTPLVQAHQPAG